MRRTTYRQEAWGEFRLPSSAPLPIMLAFPGDASSVAPGDEHRFFGDIHIKVLAVDTSTRIGAITLAVGHGPGYEGRTVVSSPIRRRTLAPLRLSRGMRRHIRRMKAAR